DQDPATASDLPPREVRLCHEGLQQSAGPPSALRGRFPVQSPFALQPRRTRVPSRRQARCGEDRTRHPSDPAGSRGGEEPDQADRIDELTLKRLQTTNEPKSELRMRSLLHRGGMMAKQG